MAKVGGNHPIYFPPVPELAKEPAPVPKIPNSLGNYASALREVELIRERLRGLVISENRHGDLQIILSAGRRLEESVLALIEAEERS